MKSRGWLEGDGGEEDGVTVGREEESPSDSGGLSLLGYFTPLGPGCASGSFGCLLSSFIKNLSNLMTLASVFRFRMSLIWDIALSLNKFMHRPGTALLG